MRPADTGDSGIDSLGTPGCALAIVSAGRIVYSRGYGMADLEQGVPISPRSVFYAGSVSKQFVAACVLLLREQGRIDLEADVRAYIPELPDYGQPITVRHLIHHSSGLRDYLDLWLLSGRDYLNYMEDEAVLEMILRQRELNFRPGTRYAYSNSGYFLLKEIIERVSGQSLRAFAHEHIFEVLGMDRSHFHDDLHHLIPERAESYRLDARGRPENLAMRFDLVGSGGLYTTVEDLFLWDQNFYANRLGAGSQAFIDTLQQPGRLEDGSSPGYAFAMWAGTYRGLRTYSHTGSMGGYRAYYLRLPEQAFSLILLGNFAQFRPVDYAERIVDLVWAPTGSKAAADSPARPEAQPIVFSASLLREAPGNYYSPELDARARVYREGEDLFLRIAYAEPIRLNTWLVQAEGNQFAWEPEKGGFLLGRGGLKNIRFERVAD